MSITTNLQNKGRVEAKYKVTGKATYSAEYNIDNVCYGVLVGATIANGIIKGINTEIAKNIEGVIDVVSFFNKPNIEKFNDEKKRKELSFYFPIFFTDKIYYKGQYIALVLANTFEDATFAASLISADYEIQPAIIDFDKEKDAAKLNDRGKERGSIDDWKQAKYIVEQTYHIQIETHHPMEPHATIAQWIEPNKLRLYDKNQGVNNVQRACSAVFNIPAENIEVISEYVGGGFGSGLRVWTHVFAAIMASKMTNKPVKVVLTREQMNYAVGYRPQSWQYLKIGCDTNGNIQGLIHQGKNNCSFYEDFSEGLTGISRMLYLIPNLKTEQATVPLHLPLPTWMRAPGECSGAFALECILDELSYKMNIDPMDLRLKNIALAYHPDNNLPWSSNYVKECILKAAEMIEWKNRKHKPRQIKQDDEYIGYGMAVGMWGAGRTKASASVTLTEEGKFIIKTAMTDIGTGTGTAVKKVAVEYLGISPELVKVELGNSNLPQSPSQGGSIGLSSVTGAVVEACKEFKVKLAKYASTINPAFNTVNEQQIKLTNEYITQKDNEQIQIKYSQIFNQQKLTIIQVEKSSAPGEERKKYAFCSSATHFCKLKVNETIGKITILKMVAVVDGGKIINEFEAANQVSGAVVGGIGMALMEQNIVDKNIGGFIGNDLANYHFAVNADAPIIETAFIDKPDYISNPTGLKGLGEVGLIGSAAAIANALYNAIGKRITSLPITPDKIMM